MGGRFFAHYSASAGLPIKLQNSFSNTGCCYEHFRQPAWHLRTSQIPESVLFGKITSTQLTIQGIEIGVRVGVGSDGRERIEVTNLPDRPHNSESRARRDFVSAFQRELVRVKARK